MMSTQRNSPQGSIFLKYLFTAACGIHFRLFFIRAKELKQISRSCKQKQPSRLRGPTTDETDPDRNYCEFEVHT